MALFFWPPFSSHSLLTLSPPSFSLDFPFSFLFASRVRFLFRPRAQEYKLRIAWIEPSPGATHGNDIIIWCGYIDGMSWGVFGVGAAVWHKGASSIHVFITKVSASLSLSFLSLYRRALVKRFCHFFLLPLLLSHQVCQAITLSLSLSSL